MFEFFGGRVLIKLVHRLLAVGVVDNADFSIGVVARALRQGWFSRCAWWWWWRRDNRG
jgi:hypothetical protein